jgi:hypothetical protein
MSGIYKDDDWTVGEAKINGLPWIVRIRSQLPARPDREIYENLIIISWQYSADESGMPERAEHKSMNELEDAIEQQLEPSGLGVQAASTTGNGTKEWRYYTYDTDEFMDKFNQSLVGHQTYPIEIQLFKDPDWSGLSELLPA